jgi:hypothetical protein
MPKAKLDENGQVIPYLSVQLESQEKDQLSINIFQCWGGGHYQALFPAEKS